MKNKSSGMKTNSYRYSDLCHIFCLKFSTKFLSQTILLFGTDVQYLYWTVYQMTNTCEQNKIIKLPFAFCLFNENFIDIEVNARNGVFLIVDDGGSLVLSQ